MKIQIEILYSRITKINKRIYSKKSSLKFKFPLSGIYEMLI